MPRRAWPSRLQGMHCVTLITRPGRAAALVVTVGLLFGFQSTLAFGGLCCGGRLRPDRGARRGDHRGRRVCAAPQPLRLDRRRDRASRPCPRDPPGCGLARDRLRDLAAAARRGPLDRGCWHGVPCPGATPRGRYAGAASDRRAGRHPARDPVRPDRRRPRRRDPLARRRRRASERLRRTRRAVSTS